MKLDIAINRPPYKENGLMYMVVKIRRGEDVRHSCKQVNGEGHFRGMWPVRNSASSFNKST